MVSESNKENVASTQRSANKFTPAQAKEPLVDVDLERANNSSSVSLTKNDRAVAAYDRVLELLASDAQYQKEVQLGKRVAFYRLGKEIGSGNFSKVRIGIHVLTKEKVAVKVIEKAKLDQKGQKLLEREVKNMEEMHHPNIVRLFEVVETLSRLHLVLEYAGGGELYTYVLNEGRLRESEAKRIYAQIVAAIIHMHEKLIIHRDIKAENVFFAGPGWVKLGDFGFSAAIEPGTALYTFCGSPPYAAPELFRDQDYQGEFVDVWALGVLLYFVVVGNTPFRGETVAELKRQILDGYFTIPEHVSPFCQDLVNGILRMQPMSRYTLGEIQCHYWLGHTKFPEAYVQCSATPDEDELKTNVIAPRVWQRMHELGVTDKMLKDAADRGAKNSVVGTYRIVLCQVQLEAGEGDIQKMLDVGENASISMADAEHKSMRDKKSRLCTIL